MDYFEKLPRPILRWVCIAVVIWAAILCDVTGLPLDGTVRGVLLTFVASVYGIRGWEKIKGAA